MKAVFISGSRNPDGQTARAMHAFLKGFKAAGGEAKEFFLPAIAIERCRQCDQNGWGLCRSEGRCVIEDDFAGLVEELKATDGAVFANPVYFGDLSESMRAFLDRLRRISFFQREAKPMQGKPAVGICVAGGGGGGAPNCALSMERVLATIGFDVVDMVPARRQNLAMKLELLERAGAWFAGNPASQA